MKLETKIPVTYNAGIRAQETGIVTGELITENPAVWENDFNTIGANFCYKDANGQVIAMAGFRVEGDQIEQLYDAVKDQIPAGLNYRDTTRYLYYFGFMQEMAQTFEITTADIDLIA